MPDEFNLGLSQRQAAYRLYPQAIPSAYAIQKLDRAPCTITCPANINVQGYIQLVKTGKYEEAVRLIMQQAPFPGTLGRICPHPCEEKCRRQEVDDPIAISALKRFAADSVDLANLQIPVVAADKAAVAIIGSGPAGLTCAYHLRLQGYRPTIFEALPKPGGMMRVGIPEYRLPRQVLDQEINKILSLGVELKTETALGKDLTIDDLFNQGYKAVFLGIGCHKGRSLGIEGEETPGVLQGVDFLRLHNLGSSFNVGKKIAVIGGGNVALDVASAARRYGASVTIVYRRSREEMPAHAWEIDQGLCEGVRILYQTAPLKVFSENGRVSGLLCQQMDLAEKDASGRRKPIPIAGAEFEMAVDMVVAAIGQEADLSILKESGIQVSRYGTIEVDEVTYATSRPGVFAAGDAHTGPWIAIEAIGGGIEAAESIDRYIRGMDMKEGRVLGIEARQRWREIPRDEEGRPREVMATLPPEVSSICFAEILQGYTEKQAIAESTRCLNCGICSECMECVTACKAEAVDHQQNSQKMDIEVGSVILAPGYQTFDPSGYDAYAYHHPNVITTLEFERMLSPGGPFKGHVQRLSDGKDPKKIAWVLCVGSRSLKEGFEVYCSNVCCMTALKQAVVAREHVGPELDMALFYIDMRTTRKDFEKYQVKIKDQGARLIRSRVHSVQPMGDSGDLKISYVTDDGQLQEEVFDMVVLAVAMVISPDTVALARELKVDLSHNKFVEASCFKPGATSRSGVYACGVFTGPKDIPQSVMEGSAVAGTATRMLASARGSLLKYKDYPVEKDVTSEPPRVGVFVCNCGINIGGVADVPAIVDYARTIPNVEYVQDNLFSCSEDAQKQMIEKIKEYDLNRVVVAACSPSTHQPIFQDMVRNAGLNKYLFEMANIRNQCTWVHQQEPALATEKCQDLVNMAVAKARLFQPLAYLRVGINRQALVVGGGVTGMTAAMGLADQGYKVHLVERTNRLGGNALKFVSSWRGEGVTPFVDGLINEVIKHPKITVHFDGIITEVSGSVGNYRSKLSNGLEIDHGVVVLAIGAEPFRPEGQYLYKQHPNVLLSLDLDQELAQGSDRIKQAQAVAFIQCVGSRIPERPYCSKVCCSNSVEKALKLKELNPDMDVYILYRDMRTYGERETQYTMARDKGVIFFRYQSADPPKVEEGPEGKINITVTDHILQRPVTLQVDLLTLATAIIPHYNLPLAELYKVPLNAEGFFTEAHAKIRPVDSSTEGIFLAGLCHYPKPIQESIAEALATASRANTILSKNFLELESTISCPIDENCDGCAFCVDTCPYKAITLLEYMKEGSLKKTVEINEIMCKGCGSCMATCPKQGIYVAGFTPEQLGAQVEAALGLA
jgi:heterodisulfide reductase subunit A-like polyferredoxin